LSAQQALSQRHTIKNIVLMNAAVLQLIKELWRNTMRKKLLEAEQ
jgi:hypothetical protein